MIQLRNHFINIIKEDEAKEEKNEKKEESQNKEENEIIEEDSTSIDSETKTKNILSSNLRNSDETRYNSDNKSISIERPEKIDDLIQPSQSSLNNNDNNIINKSNNKKISYIKFSSPTKSTKIPNKFNLFLERNEGFQRRQKENLDELQKGYEQNIKKLMKEKSKKNKKTKKQKSPEKEERKSEKNEKKEKSVKKEKKKDKKQKKKIRKNMFIINVCKRNMYSNNTNNCSRILYKRNSIK